MSKILGAISYQFRNWVGVAVLLAAGFILGLWALSATNAATDQPPVPAQATIATWVHVFGCPRPAAHVVLVFTNGKILVVEDATLTHEQQAKLIGIVGNVRGTIITYQCSAPT